MDDDAVFPHMKIVVWEILLFNFFRLRMNRFAVDDVNRDLSHLNCMSRLFCFSWNSLSSCMNHRYKIVVYLHT